MNNAHLHLVVNHLPIIFPVVGIILLLIGIFTKSDVSKRNAYLVFILGAIASIIAMLTGENAEESIEHLAGISENAINLHEESAETFAAISYFLGAISLFSLIANFKNWAFSKFLPFVTLVFALITMFFASQTGNSGGEIRHSEIKNGVAAQNGNQNENTTEKTEKTPDKDEDDD